MHPESEIAASLGDVDSPVVDQEFRRQHSRGGPDRAARAVTAKPGIVARLRSLVSSFRRKP